MPRDSEKEELELQLRQVPEIERRIAELEAVVREREEARGETRFRTRDGRRC